MVGDKGPQDARGLGSLRQRSPRALAVRRDSHKRPRLLTQLMVTERLPCAAARDMGATKVSALMEAAPWWKRNMHKLIKM